MKENKLKITTGISISDHKKLKAAASLIALSMKALISVESFIRKKTIKMPPKKDELTAKIEEVLIQNFNFKKDLI